MARRRRSRLAREWRKAKRAMNPNRVAARFISGGKHQTFQAIATSPFRLHTITSSANRRDQYRAHKRKVTRQVQAARRAERRRAEAQRKAERRRAAELKRLAPKPPRKPRPKSPPIAVNPRTGKPITYAQAVKALHEAQDRAERLAAGLPGDPPARKPRKTAAKKTAAPRTAPARPATRRTTTKPRQRQPKKTAPPSDPTVTQGKNLRGVYYAATCSCQGTGRIAVFTGNAVTGSVSCPKHGRKARGSRKVLARRAMKNAGLPGLAGWLDSRTYGNSDKQQRRAHQRSGRRRYAGPTLDCRACDEGVVNRDLTLKQREAYIARIQADRQAAGRRPLGERKLEAMARKAWPFDRCRQCQGLGRVPSQHAGPWYQRTTLPQQHQPTARETATGRRRAGR